MHFRRSVEVIAILISVEQSTRYLPWVLTYREEWEEEEHVKQEDALDEEG